MCYIFEMLFYMLFVEVNRSFKFDILLFLIPKIEKSHFFLDFTSYM